MKQPLNGYDERACFLEVEFIGGPYDGHKEPSFTRPVRLPVDLIWFVCEDAFRMLDGKEHQPGGSITSVALYELEIGDGACRYRFARAISVEALTDSLRELEIE